MKARSQFPITENEQEDEGVYQEDEVYFNSPFDHTSIILDNNTFLVRNVTEVKSIWQKIYKDCLKDLLVDEHDKVKRETGSLDIDFILTKEWQAHSCKAKQNSLTKKDGSVVKHTSNSLPFALHQKKKEEEKNDKLHSPSSSNAFTSGKKESYASTIMEKYGTEPLSQLNTQVLASRLLAATVTFESACGPNDAPHPMPTLAPKPEGYRQLLNDVKTLMMGFTDIKGFFMDSSYAISRITDRMGHCQRIWLAAFKLVPPIIHRIGNGSGWFFEDFVRIEKRKV
ncbi:Uncharacterized protein TCM_012857 [Theobroma cacao]|uniref:Uncharacterized protein n=1 Tax=Theobroma cacao TaxID=3641 RepID=A0A061G2T6_THECC|nr:Uncharacterized protein TCM_012857 [Theobroma cacao]